MAFFTDTINKQVATQLNVANQIQRQKQAEQATAMAQYALAKKFGDNKLEGQSTRTMMNQGLIPGLFTQGMDGLRGLAQGVGMDVKGVERHAHNVDNSLTNSLLPDMDGGLTPEQQEENARNQELASMTKEDRWREAAYDTYKKLYPEISEADMEGRFRSEYLDSKGNFKSRETLPEDIKESYNKTERDLLARQQEAKAFKAHKDEEKELREIVKKHGIGDMKEFSGSHSNMRNQNLKAHKALIDYYAKKKNWDKAEEINQAYIQNEMNIDKHWGMGGERRHSGLFKRPTGPARGKKELYQVTLPGRDGFHTANFTPDEANDPEKMYAILKKLHPDLRKEDMAGVTHVLSTKGDRADTKPEADSRVQAEMEKAVKEWDEPWFAGSSRDADYNRKNARNGKFFFIDGQPVQRSQLTEADVDRIAMDILNPKKGKPLDMAKYNQIKKMVAGY